MTAHEPCKEHESKAQHRDEGVPFCRDCEIDALRGLLRQVANSTVVGYISEIDFHVVRISDELWMQLAPLRSTNKKEG